MLGRHDLDTIAGRIRAASTSTETRFLDIGRRLESSVTTLEALTRTFDTLSDALKGENLHLATRGLSDIAAGMAGLGKVPGDERSAFEQLGALIAAIERRVLQMGKAVEGVGMLAMNAKIAAANIGDAGLDFVSFTTEIGRTLLQAQTSLENFTDELGGVGKQLRAATLSQKGFEEHQSKVAGSIATRLTGSTDAIAARGQRALAAATAVGARSHQIAQRIGEAVMALQIGDSTRQRIEHVDYAFGVLNEILAPGGPAAAAGSAGDWAALGDDRRQALIALGGRLQSAQLIDNADAFDQEVQQILASLQALAAEAGEILRLGQDAFGGDEAQGSFLGEIEKEVGEVEALLSGVRTARTDADAVVAAVSASTASLAAHIRAVRSLEADIRIMGLNTTLKCGRLGTVGKPLSIIAQELRVYANQIAMEASAVMEDLDSVVATAGQLSGRSRQAGSGDITDITATIADTVSRLGLAGQGLADALATLNRDGGLVAGLLGDTATRTAAHEEIGRVLRQAAGELDRAVSAMPAGIAEGGPEAERMLERMARTYTMERERAVHDRYSGGRPLAASAGGPPAAADIDDIFF